jgi:hypothetical protein
MSVRALCHTPARSAPPRPRASQGCEWMDAVSTLTHRSQSSPSGATTKGSPGSARRHARAEAPASARAEQTAPARARRRWSGSPPARAAAPTPPSHLISHQQGPPRPPPQPRDQHRTGTTPPNSPTAPTSPSAHTTLLGERKAAAHRRRGGSSGYPVWADPLPSLRPLAHPPSGRR